MDRFWTNERCILLSELWLAGYAADKIAERIGGVTRCGVIGKAHRLGLPRHTAANKPARTTESSVPKIRKIAKERQEKQKYIRRIGVDGKHHQYFTHGVFPVAEIVDSEIPVAQRRTLMKLRSHQCKYPVGDPKTPDFFYCGALQQKGSPYCPAHHQRCYQPPEANPVREWKMGQWAA